MSWRKIAIVLLAAVVLVVAWSLWDDTLQAPSPKRRMGATPAQPLTVPTQPRAVSEEAVRGKPTNDLAVNNETQTQAPAEPTPDLRISFPQDQHRSTDHTATHKLIAEVSVEPSWRRLMAHLKVVVPEGFKVRFTRLLATDQSGKRRAMDPGSQHLHRAYGCSLRDMGVDTGKPFRVEMEVSWDTDAPPAPAFSVTWWAIDDGGEYLDPVVVGPAALLGSADGLPRVVDFARSHFGTAPPGRAAPDLVLYFALPPKPGNLAFIPYPRLSFVSPPETILAFDAQANDLIKQNRVAFGDARLFPRGDMTVPLTAIADDVQEFAVIIRGALVHLDDGVSEQCRLGFYLLMPGDEPYRPRTCALVDEGKLLDPWADGYLPTACWVGSEMANDGALTGQGTSAWQMGESGGYLDSMTLGALYHPHWLASGDIRLRPAGGYRFVRDEHTRVYALDRGPEGDSATDISEDVDARLDVSEHGDLIVHIDRVHASAEKDVRLVIVAPRVEPAADDPIQHGKLLTGGTAVRGAVDTPRDLISKASTGKDGKPLPRLRGKPPNIDGWKPVASFDQSNPD